MPGPRTRYGRWIVVATLVVCVGAVAFAVGLIKYASPTDHGDPCVDLKGALDGVWDTPHRNEVMRHFAEAPGVVAGIERYTLTWLAARDQVCRDPSSTPQRARCLDHKLAAVRETVHLLPKTSPERALEIVEALPTLEDCDDVARERALLAKALARRASP